MASTAAFAVLLSLQSGIAETTADSQSGNEKVSNVLAKNEVLKGKDRAVLSNKWISVSFDFGKGSGIVLNGLTEKATGKKLVKGGTNILSVRAAGRKEVSTKDMKLLSWDVDSYPANPAATRAAEKESGKGVHAVLESKDGAYQVEWRAILRENSKYLRQEFVITALHDTAFESFIPLQCVFSEDAGQPSVVGNVTHGNPVTSERLFAGLETPMSVMKVGGREAPAKKDSTVWSPESFQDVFANDIPQEVRSACAELCAEMDGPVVRHVKAGGGEVQFAESGECRVEPVYEGGSHKLNIIAVSLADATGKTVSCDAHRGSVGDKSIDSVYTLQVPAPGAYTLHYWVENKTESITAHGSLRLSLPLKTEAAEDRDGQSAANMVCGEWVRKALLPRGRSWTVSSVTGLLDPEQPRRSFLHYSERERAVPYRLLVHYNDWYEVGIRVHDNSNPLQRTTDAIWKGILAQWKHELFDKRKTNIDAFVIDDGWDDFNSLWEFHAGFPNGFASINRAAVKMGAGIGTWLGPVGGYGSSKQMRISYWNKKHPRNQINNFKLSNQEYFDAFVSRCSDMIKKYDMRYFKFDGISTKFHADGPADLEDAEGIIRVATELRKKRPDIFINATVGTWASPFWFHFVDSVWRQENDFGQVGNAGDARDRWITYRDRLVYEVFVQGAPLFPINCLMTHGTIITRNGPPSVMSKDPANCIKEMRTAFGCGSGLQEVYADAELLNQENGKLWDELASCIAWIRRNADVLADVHWVGGNPWDGNDGSIYGWAAWNPSKCTLTLRNSSASAKTLRTTLRQLFEIPGKNKEKIKLISSFADQRKLPGFMDELLDVDAELEITLEPGEVIVMEGKSNRAQKKKKNSKRR